MRESTILKVPFSKKRFTIFGDSDDISSFAPLKDFNTYETGTMRVLKRVIKSTDMCIDIGGNIGLISLPLGLLAKKGQVYAFEPESNNYENFIESIKSNKIKNVDVFCCGISDVRETRALMFESDKLACNHMTDTDYVTEDSNTKDALFIPLTEFIQERAIDKIDFIKIDVEGAEVKILKSIKSILTRDKPTLIVEIAPAQLQSFFNNNPRELFDIVSKIYKYVYWIDDETGELTHLNDYSNLEIQLANSKGWDNILCSKQEVK